VRPPTRRPAARAHRNNDNILSRAEVVGEVTEQFNSSMSPDANTNGTLSISEWRRWRAGLVRYDTNQNGVLSRQEFTAGGGTPASFDRVANSEAWPFRRGSGVARPLSSLRRPLAQRLSVVACGAFEYARRVSGSRVVSLALLWVVGFLPIAPPEHVHESQQPDHHDVVVHRHAEPHAARAEGGQGDGSLDAREARIQIRSTFFTLPPMSPGVFHAPVSVFRLLAPVAVRRQYGPIGFVERLIHGPPRAPPSSPAV
jgi:hypothetical protein